MCQSPAHRRLDRPSQGTSPVDLCACVVMATPCRAFLAVPLAMPGTRLIEIETVPSWSRPVRAIGGGLDFEVLEGSPRSSEAWLDLETI